MLTFRNKTPRVLMKVYIRLVNATRQAKYKYYLFYRD